VCLCNFILSFFLSVYYFVSISMITMPNLSVVVKYVKYFPGHKLYRKNAYPHFLSFQPGIRLHCKTTDKRRVHRIVCLFIPHLMLVLSNRTHIGMASRDVQILEFWVRVCICIHRVASTSSNLSRLAFAFALSATVIMLKIYWNPGTAFSKVAYAKNCRATRIL